MLERLDGVEVHIRLLVVVGNEGGAYIAVHGSTLLKLQCVAGKMLRVQLQGLRQRVRPVALRLTRKTVDEIKAHVLKARTPCVFDCGLRLTEVVPPTDDL